MKQATLTTEQQINLRSILQVAIDTYVDSARRQLALRKTVEELVDANFLSGNEQAQSV